MFHGVAPAPIIHMGRAGWPGGEAQTARCEVRPPSFGGRPPGDVCSVLHGLEIETYPPALGERCHRSLACRLVAVCCALDLPIMAARPHPGAACRGTLKRLKPS